MQTDKLNCRLWLATGQGMASSALAVALLLVAGTAQAAMYRWVDGNGRVHYSDTPPTTYQQSGGAEMNKQGLVIKRTQSEAERRAEAERQAEQKRILVEQNKQAQLDRALMSTYTTEAEIDLARDRALEHHKLAIKGAEMRGKAVEDNLAELKTRIANIEKAGRPVGSNLKEQLDQATREQQELKRTIQSNEEAMTQVREKYAADKTRFRELSGKP
jgi:chromosome segregation ATPase